MKGWEGQSVTEVVLDGSGAGSQVLGEYIECACSGIMACSTCHVYVDEAWAQRVGPPSEAEQDMIDLANEPRATSRLGCQLRLTRELDGLALTVPPGVNNLFDHIPFE